ncbi:ATP-grasp domain-containing protein, partial [Candidatus Woesearchaeota archaeon]|nr:ATP-grasp domain-containing protein [Candidatus Woesearchaeota archaeon]
VIVLGSGAYRIGSSVEFDWCCVSTVLALKKLGFRTLMINYNPETVSTDYDICDKLYFDELSFEVVTDIYEKENPLGIIISMGGQIPNNIAMKCHKAGVKILGTSPLSIDNAENRHKFSALLDKLKIDQPAWKELTNIREARKFARKVGYPVLVRPSYVLSGAAMNVALTEQDLVAYLKKAADVSEEYPVVISKFIINAKEIEIDSVADKGKLVVWAISEHVENAGVHSGDATMVLPAQSTYIETIKRIKIIARQIASSLNITGPFNIQFIAKGNDVKVIECNLRASRSFPFVSKVSKVNFIDLAAKAIMKQKYERPHVPILELEYVGVKAPQFSFSRLKGADPVLSVEMASTGEVACLGDDIEEAFLKSLISTGIRIPRKNVLVSISGDENRFRLIKSIMALQRRGFKLYATEHTSQFLNKHNVRNTMIYKAHNVHKKLNIINLLEQGQIDLVINIPEDGYNKIQLEDEYEIRRKAVDFGIPLLTNLQIARLFIHSIIKYKVTDLKVKSWDEYDHNI